jgi:hypothetical protein
MIGPGSDDYPRSRYGLRPGAREEAPARLLRGSSYNIVYMSGMHHANHTTTGNGCHKIRH